MVHIMYRDRRISNKATNGTHNAQGQEDQQIRLQKVHIMHRDRRISNKATNGTHNVQGQEDQQ